MSKKYFKVGAHHMQWSGIDQIVGKPRGTISRIFPVLEVQTNMAGGRGFDAFVTLDQSGDAIMQQCSPGAEWVVAAARGEFVSEAEYLAQCADAEMVAVASYKTGRTRANGKPESALAYEVNGVRLFSLPARLNGGRIPSLDECAEILAGESIMESEGVREQRHTLLDLARSVVLDALTAVPGSRVGATMVATSDGTVNGIRYLMWCGKRSHSLAMVATSPKRLMQHWAGFVANCEAAERAITASAAIEGFTELNGVAPASFPRHLNGGVTPSPELRAEILSGVTVEEEMAQFNDAQHERLHASVRKEMAAFARRLSLDKPAMPPRPDAPGPYEDSRVIMDRIGARIAANAAGWPFDEYGVV